MSWASGGEITVAHRSSVEDCSGKARGVRVYWTYFCWMVDRYKVLHGKCGDAHIGECLGIVHVRSIAREHSVNPIRLNVATVRERRLYRGVLRMRVRS